MRNGSLSARLTQAVAIAIAAMLLACTSAFADPTFSLVSTNSAADLIQVKAGAQDPNSAISTPLDKNTADFRQSLVGKQAQIDAFNAQLTELDNELEITSQQYNAAADQLAQMKSRVQVAQTDLDNARQAYSLQTDILGRRASSIYKDGTMGGVEVLLDSKSVADFMSRVKFLNTIGLADAGMADSLGAQKDLMEKQLLDLQGTEAQAEALEFEMRARKIEVQLRIQQRQQMLATTQSDLLASLGAEAARRATQESALMQEVLSGANKAGIVVAPGSPVETALAYHGIPYLWGGATPAGFDCSGLVMYVFAQHGVTLPHYSGSQFLIGEKIDLAAIQPNDVVFFGDPVHHVGIYCGGGYFIEAPHTGSFVRINKLSNWAGEIAGVRRYPWVPRTVPPLGAVSNTSQALGSVK